MQIPKGYLYPELLMTEHIPEGLALAIAAANNKSD